MIQRIIMVGLLLMLNASVFGQNPFDLKYRSKNPDPVVQEKVDSTKLRKRPTQTQVPRTTPPATAPTTTNQAVDTQLKDDGANTSTNPFDARSSIPKTNERSNKVEEVEESEADEDAVVIPKTKTSDKKGSKQGLMLLIILTMALITTLVISSYRQIINKLTRAVLNANFLNLLYREHASHFNAAYLVLYVIFFVNGGLFMYLTSRFISPDGNAFVLIKCILFLLMVYGVRHLYMKYLSYVYDFDKEITQFDFSIMIFNIVVGLFLLPVNAFMAFAPEMVGRVFMYSGLIIFGLFYVFRQLRGILIGSNFLVSKRLYFFIYLCTTEIAPLFLTIKFFFVFIV